MVAKELDQQQQKYIFFFHLPLQIHTMVNWEPLKVAMISWMLYSRFFQNYWVKIAKAYTPISYKCLFLIVSWLCKLSSGWLNHWWGLRKRVFIQKEIIVCQKVKMPFFFKEVFSSCQHPFRHIIYFWMKQILVFMQHWLLSRGCIYLWVNLERPPNLS